MRLGNDCRGPNTHKQRPFPSESKCSAGHAEHEIGAIPDIARPITTHEQNGVSMGIHPDRLVAAPISDLSIENWMTIKWSRLQNDFDVATTPEAIFISHQGRQHAAQLPPVERTPWGGGFGLTDYKHR